MARVHSKGRCRLCGAEFSKVGIARHVEKCLDRTGDAEGRPEKLVHLLVEGEYDYGTTTLLALRVISERERPEPGQKVQVLARNNPPVTPCGVCGKPAEQVCAGCAYDEAGWLCETCALEHPCGDEMLLPVVNSPRTGACGYTGPEKSLPGWD